MLSMHRPTISEIEAGRRKVTAEELATFARTYEVSIAWLSGADTDEEISDKVRLAARELAKLKAEDLDRVMRVISMLRPAKPR